MSQPVFRSVLRASANKELVTPALRTALWSPDFKGFRVDVDGFSARPPDGWFHPSTHPLWEEALLYYYVVDPNKLKHEPFDPTGTLAVTAGTFFHTFIQTVLVETGVLEQQPEVCGCGRRHPERAEVYLVDEEVKSRGHSDGVLSEGGEGWEFKGLDVSIPILTTQGWKTMGEVEEGDEVYAPDGQPTKVVGAHDPREVRCYRIQLVDGQEIVADEDHLWEVEEVVSQRRTERRVVVTKEMVGRIECSGGYRFRIDVPKPLQMEEADLPVDPWLLGVWLGDGSSQEGLIHVGEQDLDYMISRIERLGEPYRVFKGRTAYRIQIYGLRGRLDGLGIFGAGMKRVPDLYQRGSEVQRRDLLAGIMDTDGTISQGRQLVVTMKSKALMEDVVSLVRGLGWKSSLRSHRASIDQRDAGEVWKVQFHAAYGDPFQMPRKSERIKVVGVRRRARYNAVIGIDEIASRPTRCLTVAHESSMYLVGRGFIPTHNTMNPARMQLIPKEAPDSPIVLDWWKAKAPDYYAQAQEYLRMAGRRMMVTTVLGLVYPFEMREIHVPYDPQFALGVRDKYQRVRQAIADQRPPRCACGPQKKSCPAHFLCWGAT